jgi:hypothetical protein
MQAGREKDTSLGQDGLETLVHQLVLPEAEIASPDPGLIGDQKEPVAVIDQGL